MNLKMILLVSTGIFLMSCQDLSAKSYASEAEVQIKNMVQGARNYLMQNGELPVDCWQEMHEQGYISISLLHTELWDFECSWEWDHDMHSIFGVVSAISTDLNPGGSGNVIEYYIEEDIFYGYGQ